MFDENQFRLLRLKQRWQEWQQVVTQNFTPGQVQALSVFGECFAELVRIVAKEEGNIVSKL